MLPSAKNGEVANPSSEGLMWKHADDAGGICAVKLEIFVVEMGFLDYHVSTYIFDKSEDFVSLA